MGLPYGSHPAQKERGEVMGRDGKGRRALLSILAVLVGSASLFLGQPEALAQIVVRLASQFPATNFDSVANVRLAEMIAGER